MQAPQPYSPEMGRSHLGCAQGHWLKKKKKMVGKMKEKTTKKEEEEKAPLEMMGFFGSLATNLPRKEHSLLRSCCKRARKKEEACSEAPVL